MSDRTLCSYKTCCKNCRLAVDNHDERPSVCELNNCPEYRPCEVCKKNKPLTKDSDKSLCVNCYIDLTRGTDRDFTQEDSFTGIDIPHPEGDAGRTATCSPGTPPAAFNNSEKQEYIRQWKEHDGFYKDPYALPMIHNMIIMQIQLHSVTEKIIVHQHEPDMLAILMNQQEMLIKNISAIQAKLPSKEAEDLSDMEASMAMVYQDYCEEHGKRYNGGVARMLTDEALALAPVLPFKVDLPRLMGNLGLNFVSHEQASEMLKFDDIKSALEFFGFEGDEDITAPSPTDEELNG